MLLSRTGQVPRRKAASPILSFILPDCISACFSTSSARHAYSDTISNLKIGSHTRVVFQGFTGRQATQNAKQSIEYGTKIVGGVTPGKFGEHLGLPVLPTMRAAKEQLNPDATAVYVAAHQAARAIEEAIEAEIPLIVAVAEHIPLHDMLRIHSMLRSQSKSRLVGANAPGIISPIGRCRIGFQPLPTFSAGSVGIVAKSGTLSYETVASTTRAGIGQSLVIGMGGDVLAGTNLVDALKVFEKDDATKGIILAGEIGGRAEEEAADWIQDYMKRISNPKPIMALVAGVNAAEGRIMGHAGAFIGPSEGNALSKVRALEEAGVLVTNHPSKFGRDMRQLLESRNRHNPVSNTGFIQSRTIHTLCRRPDTRPESRHSSNQRRKLHLNQSQAFNLLEALNIPILTHLKTLDRTFLVTIFVNRSTCSPCISTTVNAERTTPVNPTEGLSFPLGQFNNDCVKVLSSNLSIGDDAFSSFSHILRSLVMIFEEKEAIRLETKITQTSSGGLAVIGAHFEFDDAAFRSAKRQQDIHELRNVQDELPEELEAEKDGIVYIKLRGKGNIGTLVNGAGLAMNTVDAISDYGGKCANFLDTGGKATSETVKSSFRIILKDSRVKTIFVNIFGGLTLCDMIAEGIMLAYKDLGIKLPVVVRLRGTNEEKGQKMIAESGLPLLAFDDFEEAAQKVIELARTS